MVLYNRYLYAFNYYNNKKLDTLKFSDDNMTRIFNYYINHITTMFYSHAQFQSIALRMQTRLNEC